MSASQAEQKSLLEVSLADDENGQHLRVSSLACLNKEIVLTHRKRAQFLSPLLLGVVSLYCVLLVPGKVSNAQAPEEASQKTSVGMSQEKIERLPRVSIDGGYFTANGKRFIPVGAHWVPAKAAMQWPTQWNPADIEADFAKMHDLGYNVTRIDMVWAWFEPRPGDYNPEAFRQLDYLISLGHKYKIYIHPSLFIGGEVGEAYWDVAWRQGRNPQSDPDMLRLETNL